jgi:hypothetical protein
MAQFRVETVQDPASGLYRAEVFYPTDSATPLVVGNPIYRSHEHAMADAAKIFKDNWPDKPLTAWTE